MYCLLFVVLILKNCEVKKLKKKVNLTVKIFKNTIKITAKVKWI